MGYVYFYLLLLFIFIVIFTNILIIHYYLGTQSNPAQIWAFPKCQLPPKKSFRTLSLDFPCLFLQGLSRVRATTSLPVAFSTSGCPGTPVKTPNSQKFGIKTPLIPKKILQKYKSRELLEKGGKLGWDGGLEGWRGINQLGLLGLKRGYILHFLVKTATGKWENHP